MKYFLKDILSRLQKYSATLDQESFLVDKPWVVSYSDGKFEKLIFKRDGSVILSINGDVTIGKWEYFSEAQSLLIDYGDKKKLYKHQYLDEAVLALKIDGPDRGDENYYMLANENVIHDYDALKYLERQYTLCGGSQNTTSKVTQHSASTENKYFIKEGNENTFSGLYTPLDLKKMELANKLNPDWIVIPYKGQTYGMLCNSKSNTKIKDII